MAIGRELRLIWYALEAIAVASTHPVAMRATVATNPESFAIPSPTEDARAALAEVSRKVVEATKLAEHDRAAVARALYAAAMGAVREGLAPPCASNERPEDALERAAKAIGADARAVKAARASLLALGLDVEAVPLVRVAELLVVVMRLREGAASAGGEAGP